MRRIQWLRRAATAAFVLTLGLRAAAAADIDGVRLPDTETVAGTELRLNGTALRTYSWLNIHIYVAGLYLPRPTRDAKAILASPDAKVLIVHFVHKVDADAARKSWQQGFARNCTPPCHIDPTELSEFMAAVPAVNSGDQFEWMFEPGALRVMLNGRSLGTINDMAFARAILATFIGPAPVAMDVKRELLGAR